MNEKIVLTGRSVTAGVAEGEAIVSKESFGFTHGLEPSTGQVVDKRHEWMGQNVKGKVLVFPYGKSSTTGGQFICEAVRLGNAPAAIVNVETEPVIGAGFIIANILYNKDVPVVDRLDRNPVEVIKTGDWVRVDANQGIVKVIKPVK